MTTVDVNAVFVSWLQAQLPGVGVADRRPGKLEDKLPFVYARRSGGGDRNYLDNPQVDVDCFDTDRDAAVALAGRVHDLFRATPAAWMGVQFTLLRCVQAPLLVGDANPAVAHVASGYDLSLS